MKKTVLIVEDEVLIGMMLARKIEEYGFSVSDVVGTGEEALAAAERYRPGVILMDVSLGGEMDGIEAAAEIREQLQIPVIFFSGYNRDENLIMRAKEVQALTVLDKLGPIEDVAAALERAFDQ